MSVVGRWSQPVDATLYLKGEMECALMGQRFHRGFTAAEKTELWDRWKRGPLNGHGWLGHPPAYSTRPFQMVICVPISTARPDGI